MCYNKYNFMRKVYGTVKKGFFCRPGKIGSADMSDFYILITAVIVFLHMSLRTYTEFWYEQCLIIPCVLYMGVQLERGKYSGNKRILILPIAMVVWFLFLQVKRSFEYAEPDNIGLFLSVYLFAFPLAYMQEDGEKKKTLKIFAGAYLAAAAVLSMEGLLLLVDHLPGYFCRYILWNGGRLEVFWHPNIAACFWMIGVVFCTTFLEQTGSCWLKLGSSALLVLLCGALALTHCRTATILTGGYLGALLFFKIIKHGWEWFVPGVIVVFVITAVFYTGAKWVYEANSDLLVIKYTQQMALENAEGATIETEVPFAENEEAEEAHHERTESADSKDENRPVTIDPVTGDVQLKTDSPQGSLARDFGSLNSRTHIWNAAKSVMRDSPSIFLWGIQRPGEYVSSCSSFKITHLHNAWVECFMGLGIVGFLIAVVFTLIAVWNSLVILLKHNQDVWKRNVALLTLCLLAASVLEPYLFYTTLSYNLIDFLFFLCVGYLLVWQKEDNRHIINWIRGRMSFR